MNIRKFLSVRNERMDMKRAGISRWAIIALASIVLFLVLLLLAVLPNLITPTRVPTSGAFIGAAAGYTSLIFVFIAAVVLALFWRYVIAPNRAPVVKQGESD